MTGKKINIKLGGVKKTPLPGAMGFVQQAATAEVAPEAPAKQMDPDVPVLNFKASMKPVAAPVEVAELPAFDEVKNADTGNIFEVVGKTQSGMRVSLRFWKENASDLQSKGRTLISFRVRVGDLAKQDIPIPEVEFTTLTAKEHWSKIDSKYGSIQGALDLPCYAWEKLDAAALSIACGFATELCAFLSGICTMVISPAQFEEFVATRVAGALKDIAAPQSQAHKVNFLLGPSKSPVFQSQQADKKASVEKDTLKSIGL